MNKKFLSAILFGTLMVGTAGTFTSCKDYDDDIDQINNELSGIKSQIEALEGKIKDGKWITSVAQTANGLTITLSDGTTYDVTNGKDGAAGTPGAAGTEWTISEDGYWVCNGEKTDVMAVGQKGEDAQQEVKFENGKWFLWNGTEFVEFKGAATTENVPYYYTDPNDQNYTILVVFDKDGQNKKEIRLPMNEGLAQITLLDASSYVAQGAKIKVGYGLRQSKTEWDGDKALPAEGEYLVAVNTNSILVQVTPANYDLAALDLKFVNGKGEEVPVTVSEATPATLTKAVSATGVYKIDVAVNPIKENEELIKFYENEQPISLMANESVRSTYSSTLQIERPSASTYSNFFVTNVSAESGKDITVEPTTSNDDKVCFIYDAYLEVEGSEANKAQALKNGIEVVGMTVKSNENARGGVKFVAHYVDVLGKVYEQKGVDVITITFAPEQAPTEEIDYAAIEHTVAFVNNPSSLVNLDEYFKDMSENDRILWNATYELALDGDVVYSYVDENNAEYADRLNGFITISNNEGTSLSNADELKKLKNLKFTFDYSKAFNGAQDLFNYDVNYVATVAVKEKTTSDIVQLIKVPFTINRPSAEAIATQYTFNANAYDAAKNALVVKGRTATLGNLITLASGAKATQISFANAAQPTPSTEYNVTNSGVVNLDAINGKYNKAYPVTGINIVYATHNFAIPTVNVIFQETAQNSYTFGLSKALTINFGGNTVAVKMGDLDKNDTEDAGLNLYDAVGNKLKDVTITKVTLDNPTLVTLVPAATTDGIADGFTLKANSNPEVDTVVTAEVEFTLSDGTAQKTKANVLVTVKAI